MEIVLSKVRGPFLSRIFGLVPSRGDPIYTPLFIPSVSSTVHDDWRKATSALSRGTGGHGLVLVSAYDLAKSPPDRRPANKARSKSRPSAKRASLRVAGFRGVVLDSGGYEARKLRGDWKRSEFERTVEKIRADIVVGFDPIGVWSAADQVSQQIEFLAKRPKGTVRTLLLHLDLESDLDSLVCDALLPNAMHFDILGLAEKDLGPSFPERFRRIVALRRATDRAGLVCPIHLFGTDDPLSLSAYAMAGVDIFDGLGWATEFVNKETMSRHDLGHGPLCPRWRSFALEAGFEAPIGADVHSLTMEWNLRELAALMAELRRGVLKDEEAVLREPFRRAVGFDASSLLEELSDGR
jgi:hypothetical protein